MDLEDAVGVEHVVEDVAHVIGPVRIGRYHGGRPEAWAAHWVRVVPPRRIGQMVVRHVGQEVRQRGEGIFFVDSDQRGKARTGGMDDCPAQTHGVHREASHGPDRTRAVEVGGGIAGEHDMVDQPEQGSEAAVNRPRHGQQQGHDTRQPHRSGRHPAPGGERV